MPIWLQYLLTLAILALIAPWVAWVARREGSKLRGGLALAGLMFGLGRVLDPPSKHLIEATSEPGTETPAPGDSPETP